jgi:uncharacterized damage-inducible protein DinB
LGQPPRAARGRAALGRGVPPRPGLEPRRRARHAEWIWLERWKGVSPTRGFDEAEFKDVIAIRDRWVSIEEHRASWLRGLKKDDPSQKIRYKNLQGQAYESPLWQLVQHVANHSTYHRGQLITMLRQLGAKPAVTDMVVWDREREAKQSR